jgi:adenosine deaminase
LVSVDTDDPVLLGTSLVREYDLCRQTFAWSDAVVRAVAETSITASFADEHIKRLLREALGTC